MKDNEKYITVTAERFKELEEWEQRAKENEVTLTIQVISRYHVCGEAPRRTTFRMEEAEIDIRSGHGLAGSEINDAVRFNKEQIEAMKEQRHKIELDIQQSKALREEYYKLCDRNGIRLSKIPKWVRKIFNAL